jgi:hypothetical protein
MNSKILWRRFKMDYIIQASMMDYEERKKYEQHIINCMNETERHELDNYYKAKSGEVMNPFFINMLRSMDILRDGRATFWELKGIVNTYFAIHNGDKEEYCNDIDYGYDYEHEVDVGLCIGSRLGYITEIRKRRTNDYSKESYELTQKGLERFWQLVEEVKKEEHKERLKEEI